MIKVTAAVFGGGRFDIENGQIVDKGPHLRGFKLGADGKLMASGAEISGHIEALSGFLENIRIGKSAIFEGTVDSGPLFASNDIVTPPAGKTWNSGMSINTIRQDVNAGLISENGTVNVNFASGSFGTKTGLSKLEFSSKFLYNVPPAVFPGGVVIPGRDVYGLRLRIIFNDNTQYTFEDSGEPNTGKINNTLTVGGGAAGKTLKFKNLPGSPDGLESGMVYRNGNQVMVK